MASGDKIAKAVQKKINDKKFMNEVYKKAAATPYGETESVMEILGTELAYQIATRGKVKGNEGIKESIYELYPTITKNLTKEQQKKNILEDGFVTHSFNGGNLKSVKKNGLGSEKNFDEQVAKDMSILETYLGSSEYLKNQQNDSSELYYTSPGVKSIYYAAAQSPERLYLGPLKQDRNSALPVQIGESKKDYMMRVVKSKIADKGYTEEQAKEILQSAERVLTKFCTKRPVMALIPIKSKDYELQATHASFKNEAGGKLTTMIDETMKSDPIDFFSKNTHTAEINNFGNMVTKTKIPARNLSFVEVPDLFEMNQEIAKARGMKKGDKMDYFTGKPYKEPVVKESSVTTVPPADIEVEKQKSPELFPPKKAEQQVDKQKNKTQPAQENQNESEQQVQLWY